MAVAALEHGLAVLVGRGGVLGQQRSQLVELLEVERPEVGVLQAPDGLELGRGVHRVHSLSVWPGDGRGQGTLHRSWRRGPVRDHHARGARGAERQRIAAYGVCRDDEGRLLLARASPAITLQGRWFLPGGGVAARRGPDDSLRREIEEESGLPVVRRAVARRPLRRADDPRRHEPAHRAAHLPGGRRGRARCGPRSTGTTDAVAGSPRRRCGTCRWRTTSRPSWTGCCERRCDPRRRDEPCTTWSSSAAASAASSPPGPSSGRRCGSPSSTGPTTTSSSPCSTRWPPGSSRRARSRPPSATSCATIRPCA